MKYKVGDKVTVRSWEDMEKEFGLDAAGDIKVKCFFTKQMEKFCGKQLIIDRIDGDNYEVIGNGFLWSDDMFVDNDQMTIVVYRNNRETVALQKSHGKVVKRAIAKCCPTDTYDFKTGAELALQRLFDDDDIKVGDAVEIIDNGGSYTTYEDWVSSCIPDLSARYAFGMLPENHMKGVVKAIHKHLTFDRVLCAVEGVGSCCKQIFVMDIGAVKKCS